MQKSLTIVAILLGLLTPASASRVQETPLPPNTAVVTVTDELPDSAAPAEPPAIVVKSTAQDYPAEILVPSIKLHAKVVPMGITHSGELDVPNGNTKNVGWYKDGTIPGDVGSAVLDAHVFAAFKKLRYVKIGDDIFVKTAAGATLHYIVEDSRLYALADVPLDFLFNRDDDTRLNLITCAGKLTRDRTTYDHRLIVYATLVK